jgi:circadian clock protein KaiB
MTALATGQAVFFKFRLYVAGDTPNSLLAIANLTALCQKHLPDRHGIEIVDIFREPKRAMDDGILMTPTLYRLEPSPIKIVVGNLSQIQPLLLTLGLPALP